MSKQMLLGKNTGRWVCLAALILLSCYEVKSLALEAAQANFELTGTHLSAGVPEILKMIDAKVDIEVVKTFIRNSPVPYNLSSSEIIILKDRGVPNEVLAMILQRGGELRAQSMPSSPPAAV